MLLIKFFLLFLGFCALKYIYWTEHSLIRVDKNNFQGNLLQPCNPWLNFTDLPPILISEILCKRTVQRFHTGGYGTVYSSGIQFTWSVFHFIDPCEHYGRFNIKLVNSENTGPNIRFTVGGFKASRVPKGCQPAQGGSSWSEVTGCPGPPWVRQRGSHWNRVHN